MPEHISSVLCAKAHRINFYFKRPAGSLKMHIAASAMQAQLTSIKPAPAKAHFKLPVWPARPELAIAKSRSANEAVAQMFVCFISLLCLCAVNVAQEILKFSLVRGNIFDSKKCYNVGMCNF